MQVKIPIVSIIKVDNGIDKTAALLKYSKSILKDLEYQHLFENNDDYLLTIDFISEPELSNDLDYSLKNSDRNDTNIIEVLRKYYKTTNHLEYDWLKSRLIQLKKNTHINILALGKGLKAYEKRKNEKYGIGWFPIVMKTHRQLNEWIDETFKFPCLLFVIEYFQIRNSLLRTDILR